jgi:hypothetical protein
MSDGKRTATDVTLGVLAAGALTLAGWSLNSVNNLQQKAARFEENIGEVDFGAMVQQIEQIAADRDIDTEQNRRLDEQRRTDAKFWRISGATRDWINHKHREPGEPLFVWPDLGD